MPDTMPAVVNYARSRHAVELREVPVPTPGEDDVLLSVAAVGVCGSDLHQYRGDPSWNVEYPVVLGHEFAGTIAALGRRVRGFAEGDRVVSETAARVDDTSPFVRAGRYNLDPARRGFGYGVDGAMAPYVVVPARLLHRIPAGLDLIAAALTEPACVAYQAVAVNATVRPGDAVLVLGPGPIGLLCARIAALAGARPLSVAGTPADAARLEVARRLGATDAVDVTSADVRDALWSATDGHGYDVVVDATGASAALELALEQVRPAGTIVKVGWGPQPLGFSLDLLVAKAATLQGSFSHTWTTWERVLRLQATGQLALDELVGGIWPLERWHDGFAAMLSGDAVKSVLTPTGAR